MCHGDVRMLAFRKLCEEHLGTLHNPVNFSVKLKLFQNNKYNFQNIHDYEGLSYNRYKLMGL